MNEWLRYLKRPALWERSPAPFWCDEHISKAMLAAHLNADVDAASRKHETIGRSVAWLSGMMPPEARLLDLGCGPGLYTKRLAALGYSVTGTDCSRRSLSYAMEADPASEYILGDYLALDYGGPYDAITLIYCDYAALTKAEREILLAKVKKALKPNGLFIFDVFTDTRFRQKSEGTSWQAETAGDGFWHAEPYLCLHATYLYEDNTVSADRYVIVTEGGVTQHIIWDTAYSVKTLRDELRTAGFHIHGLFGDICGKPYAEDSETLCCTACKRESRTMDWELLPASHSKA